MIKRLLPTTLFGRFALIILLPILILQASYVYIFYERHWDALSRKLADNIASDIAFVMTLQDMGQLKSDDQKIMDNIRSHLGLSVTFVSSAKVTPNDNYKKLRHEARFLYRALAEKLKGQTFSVVPIDDYQNMQVNVQTDDGVLTLTTSRRRLFSSTTYIFVLWMISLAGLFSFLSILFARNQIRPIRRLAVAAESFGRGRDIPGFKPQGALEVRQAADAFNAMRERISRAMTQRTEMLAGVSHDLRTPLTRLKLQLALLPQSKEVKGMQEDIDEMGHMIDAYLNFARGAGEEEKAVKQDLNDFMSTLVTKFKDMGVHIETDFRKKIMLRFRPQALTRCVSNILENARRFAKTIKVTTKVRDAMAYIIIDDDGPGIPEAEFENVFKPFFRLDTSRKLDHGSVGLGMTIARDVARGHGGDVTLEKSSLGGLRVVITLPA